MRRGGERHDTGDMMAFLVSCLMSHVRYETQRGDKNQFISNREIYEKVICGLVPQARKRLWIATADIKDMYVAISGGEMIPFLGLLDRLLARGVDIRLIHAKEPGPNFRQDFERYPRLWKQLERVLCPRVHFKCIIADCEKAYFGSANLTGAGLGAKSDNRRNFENGLYIDEPSIVEPLCEQFDSIWRGACCVNCGRKKYCGDGPVTA